MSLDASKILQIKLKAEQMWADAQIMQEYKPNADAAIAVIRNQTARLEQLTDRDRENQVYVTWMDPCGVTVEDCDGSCDFDGDEPNTAGQAYELDLCKETTFKINLERLRTNTYGEAELTAQQMLLHIKALDEYWARQILIKLKAFAGVNGFPGDYTYAGGTTTIPADKYNAYLWSYLQQVAIYNKMPNSYMIDDGALYAPFLDAGIDGQNAEGKGNAMRAAMIAGKLTFDFWNFGTAGLTEDTFVVQPGAVAFKTKTRYTPKAEYLGGDINEWRWTVPSRVLPGVNYDVISKLKCVANAGTGQKEDVQVYKLITRGGVFKNPNGCPITIGATTFSPTGVLSFTKDEVVA